MNKKFKVRLPVYFKPERYRLVIRPDLDNFTFYGEETIYFRLVKTTRAVVLHAKDLDIERAEFALRDRKIPARNIKYDAEAETATFFFPNKLPKGKGELHLVFRGLIGDKMRGFYRSRYAADGGEKYIVATQFEATDARRAFPCFDEPAAKAVFDVTVIIPKGYTAVSNTVPAVVAEHEPGFETVRFAPTPKMSTYLLAFIVGDLEFVEGKTKEGTLVRVFTTPGKKEQARFALGVAKRCLSFYNNYFGIPYPLPVLDLIAIPDFESAAMENWGAVTYRESAILIDPKHSSEHNKLWVAIVIAHELAHQWFGNLVTMEWWTHLWLNEGFARYMEYLTLSNLFPEWKMWDKFNQEVLGSALELDALQNTHPIEVAVHHPSEIGEIFDEISYSKGAAVIRMLAEYLGPRKFRDGLRHYLKKHNYRNAKTEDLWLALEHVSGKPVRKLMRAWTSKPGYPLLTLAERKGGLEIRQSRFFANPVAARKNRKQGIWNVPLRILRNGNLKHCLMTGKTLSLPGLKAGEWLKLNAGGFCLYRADYPAELLHLIRGLIATGKLGVSDRLNVIRDAFALAEAGKLSTREALILAAGYKNESDYPVWVEIAHPLNFMEYLWKDEDFYPDYRRFCLELFSGIARRVGWRKKPREKHEMTLLRSLALYQAGRYGDVNIIRKAQELFRGRRGIHPDLRGAVYRLVAENGGEKEHRELLRRYRAAPLAEEKNRLAGALASFKQKNLLQRTLEFSLSRDVRPQDAPFLIVAVWRNPAGRDLTWSFVKRNWKELVKNYGDGHLLSRILASAEVFASAAAAADFKRFFRKHPAPSAVRSIAQALEQAQTNVLWRKRDWKSVGDWLKVGDLRRKG